MCLIARARAFFGFPLGAKLFSEIRCTAAFLVSSGSMVRPWLGVADLVPELPTWEGIEFIAKWRVHANLGGCSAPVNAGLNFLTSKRAKCMFCLALQNDGLSDAKYLTCLPGNPGPTGTQLRARAW